MPAIGNRYDFVYLFDVTDGNPNGDPDAGNQPRIDPETGEGLVTDVCLKRKVRNFVSLAKRDAGKPAEEATGLHPPLDRFDIYVKERGILAREQRRAYEAVKAEPGDKPNEAARRWMCQTFYDVRAFGAVMTTGKAEDEAATAKAVAKKGKAKPAADAEGDAPADGDQPAGKGGGKGGKKQWNCGQVRGPVQLTFARSVGPVIALEHAITRVALTNAGDTGRDSSNDGDEKAASGQIGRKATVPYGLYRAHGFVSPHLALDTGFGDDDLALLWQALCRMFEFDHSATRGHMTARGLYVFKHASPLGNAASHRLFELVKAAPKNDGTPRRSFASFEVTVPTADQLPKGVELLTFDCGTFADEPVVVAAP